METTTLPDYPRGITFEQVWAAIIKGQEESAKIWKSMQETNRRMDEANRRMDENNRKMGELSNRFGEMAEHLVAPGIVERFNALGYKGETLISSNVKLLDERKIFLTEIDLLLERDDCFIAVEVKSKPSLEDVAEHIKRLEIFREHRNKLRKDDRKIRGAVAGAVFPQNVKQAVLKAGLYVLAQSGDTMKIDLPSGFVPAEW